MTEETSPDQINICPHCKQQMQRWSAPEINFSDGLGFGADRLFVCFNNACPLYVKSWKSMLQNYGRVGSMRFWRALDGKDEGALPVAHEDALRGDIVPD